MIDNVVLIISGMLRGDEMDREELRARCHPLGLLDLLPALTVARTLSELYDSVLIETPLGPYFRAILAQQQPGGDSNELTETNIELVRMSLWRAYLEDFARWCSASADSVTAETMGELLAVGRACCGG